jgi:hypothetical protein
LSGNSWRRGNFAAGFRFRSTRLSLCKRAAIAVFGGCALFVSACDTPAPSTARPEPTPAPERSNAAPVVPALQKTLSPTTAPVTEKTPAHTTTPPAPIVATKAPTKIDSLITASATVDPPTARAGDTFTVRVEVQIESGWHIYAIDRPTGPSIPTSFNFELPKNLAWDGDWTGSEPALDDTHPDEPSFIYTGSVSFSRRMRVAQGAAPGAVTLRGNLHYQACDKFSCRAPTREPLKTEITIVP